MNKINITPIILEEEVNRYSYLLKTKDEMILIDPGAKQHVPILLDALKKAISISDISHVILQSNDFLNSTSLDDLIKAGFNGVIIANEAGLPYLETMLSAGIKTIEELDYELKLKNGETLQFIPMPFLPFPECFGTYCIENKILFSGHLASQSLHKNKNISELIQAINNFHEMVLPSVEFIRHVMKKLKKLEINTIYPRLGYPIEKENVIEVFTAILKYDFYNSQQVIERKNTKNVAYDYETICNHMLKQLETKYHREDILNVFKNSPIKLELIPSLEIESTTLTGYKLWNGFFDLIYRERGVTWLALLEPIVKKYNRTYNIKLPVIYKTKFVEQLKKIENLNAENVKLEEEVLNLTSQVDETMDKLLRDPITNLYNQRFMIQHLLNNLDQPLEDKKTRGLIVMQIDNLIEINKKYGSNKGDETIRNLVHIINRIKSEDTILFKRNGPAIFVYKHAINEKMLTIFALKLMNNVKDSEVFVEPITVSLGIVTIEELNSRYSLEERVNQFIDIALMRLEKAKLKGKGQVVNKNTDKDTYVEGLILLVDEDETNQNLMVKIFERINYQVIIAKDIYHAYEMLEKHNIDIIISEINLSKLDGFRLKQKINTLQNYKNIPFIIVSHHKNLDVIMRANLLDIDLILQKPIIPEELIGHIKRIRDKRVIL
jgi:diguanylate cyclase (GGDEF)-like protein